MRIKRFDISIEYLKWLLSPGRKDYTVTKNGFPDDAELVRINVDPHESTPRTISLYVTSAEYPDIPEGTYLLREHLELTRYYHADKETP